MAALELGQFLRPKQGESACGDSLSVHSFPTLIRLAVIDGLGHGPEAAAAAAKARELLAQSEKLSGKQLVQLCHRRLIGTRGAVLGIVDLDRSQNLWRGISLGNISIAFYGHDEYTPVTNGGIAGYSLPSPLLDWSAPRSPGQILVMHSDGIGQLAGLGELLNGGLGSAQAQDLAESIATKYGKIEDDLAILVAK